MQPRSCPPSLTVTKAPERRVSPGSSISPSGTRPVFRYASIAARANAEGHLYGSIGPAQIVAALAEEGLDVEAQSLAPRLIDALKEGKHLR